MLPTPTKKSRIDRAFARFNRGAGLFRGGFGAFEEHREIGEAATDISAVDTLQVMLDTTWTVRGGLRLTTGRFRSPLAASLPERARVARFWWLRPASGEDEPVWVHMAGTNESGPRRRLFVARPLAARGVSSLILENPFYGVRAPVRPEAAVIVGARHDAYVRPDQVLRLHAYWPNSRLRWFDGGHVAAYLRRAALVEAMTDAMAGIETTW